MKKSQDIDAVAALKDIHSEEFAQMKANSAAHMGSLFDEEPATDEDRTAPHAKPTYKINSNKQYLFDFDDDEPVYETTIAPGDSKWHFVVPPRNVKGEELAKLEFEERNRLLATMSERRPDWDLHECYCEDFIRFVFERDIDYAKDVQPFEEVNSKEYQIWLQQKKAGVEEIDYSGYLCWRYNPVVFVKEGKKKQFRVVLKDDQETLDYIDNRDFAIMSPATFVGRSNSAENARYLYAFAIDLDGVGPKQLRNLVHHQGIGRFPHPNLITSSGHGLHLYFLLKSPVPCYRENLRLLNRMKKGYTLRVWNGFTSTLEDVQIHSVLQGFRLPGTKTKFGAKIRCWHNAEAPLYTLEELNSYLNENRLSDAELATIFKAPEYRPTTRLEAAKELWPEWYVNRVLERSHVANKWHVKRDVYDWWKARLWASTDDVKVHHRYWCILALVIYAVKCDIDKEELRKDAYDLVPRMERITDSEDNHFTTDDVDDALKAWDVGYNTWPINSIEAVTAMKIERGRRNGRTQDIHLRRIRLLQEADYPNGTWREGNGRKPQANAVYEWRQSHPGIDNKSQCARETGLSRPTVTKWWNVRVGV